MRVGLVCEGPSDVPVLELILGALLEDGWVSTYLKPDLDNLGEGKTLGWTGVRQWCRTHGSWINFLPQAPDIIVVQLDADIARDAGADSNDALCDAVKSWLGPGAEFDGLIVSIPSQAIETWLLAANRSADPKIEELARPAERLVREKLLEHDERGRPRKDQLRYRELAVPLGQRLASLRKILQELDRFCSKIELVAGRQTA